MALGCFNGGKEAVMVLHVASQQPQEIWDWKLIGSALYNLATNIGENSNVAGANPDVVTELTALVNAMKADLAANSRPVGVHED